MSVDSLNVGPVIPVSDLDASLEFYEGALGLSGESVPGGYALRAEATRGSCLLTGTGMPAAPNAPLASFATRSHRGGRRRPELARGSHRRNSPTARYADATSAASRTWTASASRGSETRTTRSLAIFEPVG